MENLKEMNYENFLFSQLFMNYIESNETQYQELDYDVIYPEVNRTIDSYSIILTI